ncbi:unnamed protein product [Ectocarpus sp. 12 AP-2014]
MLRRRQDDGRCTGTFQTGTRSMGTSLCVAIKQTNVGVRDTGLQVPLLLFPLCSKSAKKGWTAVGRSRAVLLLLAIARDVCVPQKNRRFGITVYGIIWPRPAQSSKKERKNNYKQHRTQILWV